MGSDNGLLPFWCQAIIWTNAGLLSVELLWTHFSKVLIKKQQFSLKKIHMKMSSTKCQPSCLCVSVLTAGKLPDTWGLFHLRFASSPKYSLEICVLQKSHFLWACISSWNFVRVPLGMRTKFQLEIITINVMTGIVYFREIILESSQNVSETTPWAVYWGGIVRVLT